MASGKRNKDESFKAYRARLAEQAQVDKQFRRGVTVWASSRMGTYVKAVHGELG